MLEVILVKKLFRTYMPFSRAAVQQHILAYPLETFLYMSGMLIGMMVMYYIWKVIYSSGGYSTLEGFSFNEMVAYIILSFGALQATDNGTVWIIASEIREGSIIMNLIKPINYHLRIFADVIGITMFLFLVILLPSVIFLTFVIGVSSGIINSVLFFISLFLGISVAFLFDFLFGMLAFYVKNIWGIGFGKFALVRLLSGALIPLAFFPEKIRIVLEFLPFKSMIYTPIMIYLGKYSYYEVTFQIGFQLMWVLILMLINIMAWKKAVLNLTVQGG